MSVFIRKTASDGTYSYDFQYRGRRFSGSTGTTVKREAREVEKARREEAKALFRAEQELYAPELTTRSATARYWQEVGQHHVNFRTTLWSLDWLENHFGAGTMLHDIDSAKVAAMVARRRGETVPDRRKNKPKNDSFVPKRVSATTVNRTVTQPLREIMLRAKNVWNARVQTIDWSDHLLAEGAERVREARPDEEADIMVQLERGYNDALRFAFLTGCRRMEIVPRSLGETEERYRGLTWTRVDFFSRQITIVGKGAKARTIPMSTAIYDLLWAQQGFHPDYVFTFKAKRTLKRDGELVFVRGQRYPIVASALKIESRRAIERAGVKNFRPHDIRHTAATRVLRKSNLRVVQELLGHSDVATTTKYAHAMKEDMRAALDAISEPVIHNAARPNRNTR